MVEVWVIVLRTFFFNMGFYTYTFPQVLFLLHSISLECCVFSVFFHFSKLSNFLVNYSFALWLMKNLLLNFHTFVKFPAVTDFHFHFVGVRGYNLYDFHLLSLSRLFMA